jgi:integrase
LKGSPVKARNRKGFWDFFEDFLEIKRKETEDVRPYHNSLRKHLKKIQERMGKELTFEMIGLPDSKFSEVWKDYLVFEAPNSEGEPGLSTNTIGKQNKNLKAFLNFCFDKNITERFSLKSYPTVFEEVDKVYLTEEELEAIENVELDDPVQQKVRDLFLIGCETALRFSDFTRIEKDDIRDGQLHFRPKKTTGKANNKVVIPLSNRFRKILNKYDGQPPHFDARYVTDFNAALREVCKKARLTAQIVKYHKRAGEHYKVTRFKYEEVSSHTCRRTFCTLKFLKGMPAQAIMKFSGHKTERNFLKYLKLDAELTAKKYEAFF